MAWIDQLPRATATRASNEHLVAAGSALFAAGKDAES
jgi:hypothetical protein